MEIVSSLEFVRARQVLAAKAAEAKALARRGLAPKRLIEEPGGLGLPRGGTQTPPVGYHLTYIDQLGQESIRMVTLRRIDPARAGLRLWCFCHSAQDLRLFWAHQIKEVYCVVTGEVHDDPVTFFDTHPMLCSPKDPEGYALKVCRHEIDLLTIVAAADGRFDANEQERILIHVFDRLPQMQLDEDILRHRLALLMPDTEAYENAMGQLGRFKAGDPVALMRTMRKLVDADGHIAPEEMAFVNEIEARLSNRLV